MPVLACILQKRPLAAMFCARYRGGDCRSYWAQQVAELFAPPALYAVFWPVLESLELHVGWEQHSGSRRPAVEFSSTGGIIPAPLVLTSTQRNYRHRLS